MNAFFRLLLAVLVVSVTGPAAAVYAEQTFSEYCSKAFIENEKCPPAACQTKCIDGTENPPNGSLTAECARICVPKECQQISAENCPVEFCSVVENCSKQKICLPQIPKGEIPDCGELSYNGQDVECCKGMVKRCGFDYLDGKCNMEGKNSPYSLPICIPCGDGVCTNFENHCNCPEDCKKDLIDLP